jgi:hypothetical protein
MRPRVRTLLGRFLITILVLNSLAGFSPVLMTVSAQKRVIVVNAEQPNVWTLEQAHYLLAQMHRRNLDLRAKKLDDLDANEIAGLRFDVMRMLVEFGATFNQADLASNRLLSANQTFNEQRRQELITERDRLRRESLKLTGDIEELETEKASTEDEDAKKRLDARIAAKTNRLAKVDKEIEFTNSELGTLTAPSGQPKATEGGAQFDANRLPKSVFDKAFEAAAAQQIEKFNQAPRLNATLRLDNFLQMQYEIISKQLSLLRDELGPGERLVFLELPQTVNVAHHEADKKWAQSWWKIAGYTRRRPRLNSEAAASPPPPRVAENQEPITTSDDMESILQGRDISVLLAPSPTPPPAPTGSATPTPPPPQKRIIRYYDEFVNLDNVTPSTSILDSYLTANSAKLENRLVRTVELIPRQSSLNVNDMKLQTRAGALNFMLSTLFGFGSQLNVQRQREQFSQFVQQELYSSAFGKGAREFGWTFTPMPGTDRLQSGVRNTYAVVVVPEEASALVMESNGCYFPRSSYQPNNFPHTKSDEWNDDGRTSRNCSGTTSKAFVVPIPSALVEGGNEFWVDKISFQPVPKGKRIVVSVSGKNFSPQTGVLVNGVPLVQSIGLAQPLIRDDSETGRATAAELKDSEIPGSIERVDTNKIVFSFKMPADFQGTPTITLIAPGRATDLNWIPGLEINGVHNTSLRDLPVKMFGNSPGPTPFRIDKVRVFRSPTPGLLTAMVSGAGFVDNGAGYPRVFINGNPQPEITPESSTLLRVEFSMPVDETIKVTLVSRNDDAQKRETIESDAIPNPARLSIADVEVIVYEAATEDEPATLVVKITGTGFTDKLRTSLGEIAVKSATEAILTITDPKAAAIVTLTDEDTGQQVKTIITRKTKPPE